MKKLLFSLFCLVFMVAVSKAEIYTHVFEDGQLNNSGGLVVLSGVEWNATTATSIGWNASGKGVQIGNSSNPNKNAYELSTSAFCGYTIKSVTINSSIANGGDATFTINVGGKTSGLFQLTTIDTPYTFDCDKAIGNITISWKANTKAYYISSISVEYTPDAYDIQVDGIYYNVNATDLTCNVAKKVDDPYFGEIIIPKTINYKSKELKVTGIESFAFYKCAGLTSVVIPNSVTYIGDHAFNGCSELEKIEINCPTISDCFNSISSIEEIIIGDSVTSIEDCAFSGCSGLTSLTMGSSITSIGDDAFYDCLEIESIYLMATTPPYVGHNNFTDKHYINTVLYVPHGSLATYMDVMTWRNFWDIEEFYIDKYFYIRYIVDDVLFETDSIKHGAEIKIIDYPTKEGHTFSGWSEAPATMPAHNVTIEGSFIVNYYTVTYIVDGEVWATDSVAYGCELLLRDEPIKEGYTFSGWGEAPTTMPAHNVTIEGAFIVNSYTVTYLVDGEEYANYTLEYGAEVSVPEVPARDGYTFSWMNEIPKTMPADDITIEGTFAVNYYIVTYVVDGEVWATDSVAYGCELLLRDEPIKEGYTFSGWGEAPTTMPAKDITIEGTFSINSYAVTFVIDGEIYETVTVEYGAEIELPTVPEKEGYIFSGWINVPVTMPANDVIVEGYYIAETAIGQIDLDLEKNEVYNLQGSRITDIDELKNGIYIVNGKKILVK